MTVISESTLNLLRVLTMESNSLSVSVLPEVGAKILSLADTRSGRNLLWENPRIRPQRFPVDANFDNYWCGGWDDAFPTADPCMYQGEPYPNVGELRSLAWDVDQFHTNGAEATLQMSAWGPITPIRAVKTVSLADRVLSMRFRIENVGPMPVDFLWGTHPSFAVAEGTRLIIPGRAGLVQQANDPVLGTSGQRYLWPHLNGRDMSVVPSITAGLACGHYVTDLEDGWFAVESEGSGIIYQFPLETCPNLWLWLVYGGWRGYYHAIVEPWTGYPVNLTEAVAQGRHRTLQTGGVFDVTIRCTTYGPDESSAEALQRLRSS